MENDFSDICYYTYHAPVSLLSVFMQYIDQAYCRDSVIMIIIELLPVLQPLVPYSMNVNWNSESPFNVRIEKHVIIVEWIVREFRMNYFSDKGLHIYHCFTNDTDNVVILNEHLPISMTGALCRFCGTGCRSAAMVASLASSGLTRYEAVHHGYGTSPLEGRGCTDLGQCALMVTHWNIRPPVLWPAIPLSWIILTLNEPVIALS